MRAVIIAFLFLVSFNSIAVACDSDCCCEGYDPECEEYQHEQYVRNHPRVHHYFHNSRQRREYDEDSDDED